MVFVQHLFIPTVSFFSRTGNHSLNKETSANITGVRSVFIGMCYLSDHYFPGLFICQALGQRLYM